MSSPAWPRLKGNLVNLERERVMKRMAVLTAALCGAGVAGIASAQSVTSYDVTDAARAGFGNWQHTYNGTIVDTGNFFADGIAFTRANYTGGSGTLNDGSQGTGAGDTQLFANNNDARPIITLTLDGTYSIDNMTLYSFDSGNTIPGAIASVEVEIGGQSQVFTTSHSTTNDEFIDLTGSPLQGIPTNTVILKNFTHDGRPNGLPSLFCIGEIELSGNAGGFNIRLSGPCPGQKTLSWTGAGSGQMGIVVGNSQGNTTIPGGPCRGTQLGISGGLILYNVIGTQGGSGQVSTTVGTPACGKFVQCINTGSCETSNVAGPI